MNENGMTKEERQKVLNTIDKLFALAQSPNENEAALAASKAQELMDKYNLVAEEIHPTTKQDIVNEDVVTQGRFQSWVYIFFNELAKAHDCYAIVSRGKYYAAGGVVVSGKKLRVIGHKNNVEVFKATFNYLRSMIIVLSDIEVIEAKRACILYGDKGVTYKYRDSFCRGCSRRIVERIRESREERIKTDAACTALVVCHKQQVQEYVQENIKLGNRHNVRQSVNMYAFNQGRIAGNNVNLHKMVDHSCQKAIR